MAVWNWLDIIYKNPILIIPYTNFYSLQKVSGQKVLIVPAM